MNEFVSSALSRYQARVCSCCGGDVRRMSDRHKGDETKQGVPSPLGVSVWGLRESDFSTDPRKRQAYGCLNSDIVLCCLNIKRLRTRMDRNQGATRGLEVRRVARHWPWLSVN